MRQKRSLGQVFLKDKKYIRRILNSLDIKKETVLEIGSGSGDISQDLSQLAGELICLEIDSRFHRLLQKRFANKSNTQVVQADVLRFPLSKLDRQIVIFGNVPYQISSKLIDYFVSYRSYIKRAYLTFQKEFAEKLLAETSSSQYGVISCRIQYYAKVKKIFDIPAGSFKPIPKIDSRFIKLEFYRSLPRKAKNEELLFDIISKAFSQRRKKIINSLNIEGIKKILSSLGISPNLRAQDLSLDQYIAMADKLFQSGTDLKI